MLMDGGVNVDADAEGGGEGVFAFFILFSTLVSSSIECRLLAFRFSDTTALAAFKASGEVGFRVTRFGAGTVDAHSESVAVELFCSAFCSKGSFGMGQGAVEETCSSLRLVLSCVPLSSTSEPPDAGSSAEGVERESRTFLFALMSKNLFLGNLILKLVFDAAS